MQQFHTLSRFALSFFFCLNVYFVRAQSEIELTHSELVPPFEQGDPGAVFGYTGVAISDSILIAIGADMFDQVLDVYRYNESSNIWNRIYRRTLDHNESQSQVWGLDSDVATDGQTALSTKLIEFGGAQCTFQTECPRYAVIEIFSEVEGQWAKTQFLSPFDLPQSVKSQLNLEVKHSYYNTGFGRHIEVSGNQLIVGSGIRNSDCGALIVYEKIGDLWEFKELIKQEDLDPSGPCTDFGFWFDFLENGDLHVPGEIKNYVLSLTELGWQVAHSYAQSDYPGVSRIHVKDLTVAMNVDDLGMVFYDRMPDGTIEVADTLLDFQINRFDGFDGSRALAWTYSIALVAVDTTFIDFAIQLENGLWTIADTLQLINDPFDFGDLTRINRVAMSEHRIYLGNTDTFLGSDPLLLNTVSQGGKISLTPSGIHEKQGLQGQSIYPNPADLRVDIHPSIESELYYLFDLSGRLLTQGTCTKGTTTIDLNELHDGMYVLQIDGYHGKKEFPLLISR